jgi:hypothetical protein
MTGTLEGASTATFVRQRQAMVHRQSGVVQYKNSSKEGKNPKLTTNFIYFAQFDIFNPKRNRSTNQWSRGKIFHRWASLPLRGSGVKGNNDRPSFHCIICRFVSQTPRQATQNSRLNQIKSNQIKSNQINQSTTKTENHDGRNSQGTARISWSLKCSTQVVGDGK